VIFNERLVEIAEKYLRKGSKIYVEGALQTRKWTDQQNQERYSTEVVLQRFRGELTMLDGAAGGRGGAMEGGGDYDDAYMGASTPARAVAGGGMGGGGAGGGSRGGRSMREELDDDIPF